jgi:hypothetical protein
MMTTEIPISKVTRFTAHDESGNKHLWAFWFDKGYRHWFLRDPEGYERCLESTWIDSVPRIKAILANYSMTAEIS